MGALDQGVFRKRGKKQPHFTLGAVLNSFGHGLPPVLLSPPLWCRRVVRLAERVRSESRRLGGALAASSLHTRDTPAVGRLLIERK
jgi:hypothetical protein